MSTRRVLEAAFGSFRLGRGFQYRRPAASLPVKRERPLLGPGITAEEATTPSKLAYAECTFSVHEEMRLCLLAKQAFLGVITADRRTNIE